MFSILHKFQQNSKFLLLIFLSIIAKFLYTVANSGQPPKWNCGRMFELFYWIHNYA